MAVTIWTHSDSGRLRTLAKNQMPREKPSRPRPATEKPMTAPPRKAMGSALAVPPVRAASAVRALAAVAIRMPMNPAPPDRAAPKT